MSDLIDKIRNVFETASETPTEGVTKQYETASETIRKEDRRRRARSTKQVDSYKKNFGNRWKHRKAALPSKMSCEPPVIKQTTAHTEQTTVATVYDDIF